MKKIKRRLRLGSLKFYSRLNYWPRYSYRPSVEPLVYMCIDREYDLNFFLTRIGLGNMGYTKAMQLTGLNLYDMLCKFRDGKLNKPIYLYTSTDDKKIARNSEHFVECKTLDDLVDSTYKVDLIERLAGIK